MEKLEANMEAVILRQSEQLQMKVLRRAGLWVGWGILGYGIRVDEILYIYLGIGGIMGIRGACRCVSCI